MAFCWQVKCGNLSSLFIFLAIADQRVCVCVNLGFEDLDVRSDRSFYLQGGVQVLDSLYCRALFDKRALQKGASL